MRRKTFSRRWCRCSGGSRQRRHALLDEIAPSRASRASSSGRNFRTTWRPKRNRLLDDRSRENKIEDVSRRSCAARMRLDSGLEAPISIAARDHGEMRLQQGYTATMVVEESRILQVSIFSTLQRNLRSVDFGSVLLDVMTIADEVDSQLKQAMFCYVAPAVILKSQTVRLAG
jgi:hypothetical protein